MKGPPLAIPATPLNNRPGALPVAQLAQRKLGCQRQPGPERGARSLSSEVTLVPLFLVNVPNCRWAPTPAPQKMYQGHSHIQSNCLR